MKSVFGRLERTIQNLLARAVVTGLNTASKCQILQVELMPGEPKENVEHLEPYGFTSAPLTGAEGFALFPDGDRSHGVILMVADRRYRIKGLQAGEVAIYTDEGDSITLKRGKTMVLQTDNLVADTKTCAFNASEKITLNSPLVEATKDVKAGGDMSDKKSSMQALRDTYNDHDHNETDSVTRQPNQQM
ncbi:TPA: phage baseplate assembly protein [Enterobacter roggenkampii]|nr:phage baseplate assembly protein [Enterobacter roggenkampii]